MRMLSINLKTALLSLLLIAVVAACAMAQARPGPGNGPRMRVHTATESAALSLVSATTSLTGAEVRITQRGDEIVIQSNSIPTHAVGQFPNSGNPSAISAQDYTFTVDATPELTSATPSDIGLRTLVGVALNGVPFDPGAAEFWQGDRQSGWQYEALGGAVTLGLDANYGHVQPTGAYHYHGLPVGLMQELGWSASEASPLIGYAADGFPIYALTAEVAGSVTQMQSSYQLKSGERPGGSAPDGRYDGTFVQDYVYVEGSGDLDACNGTTLVTEDYPDGTYAYFLTEAFPVIPRCLQGEIGDGFVKARG